MTNSVQAPGTVRELLKSLSRNYRNQCPRFTEIAVREFVKPAADHPERVTTLTLISSTRGNPMLAQGEPPAVEGAMDPAIARQSAAATTAGDLRPRCAEIAVPTVVIHGEQDQLFPAAHGSDLVATIPDARLVGVPGMGHVPEEKHNPTIIDAILSVAEQVSDASPQTDQKR